MSGTRYNEGKRKWGLLSWPSLSELAKVLEFGAQKYASWNWSNGLSWSECFESLQRHATAWYCGEDKDPETGLSHMAHVMCNAMFLMHFIIFGTGKDDRPSALQEKNDNATTDEGAKYSLQYYAERERAKRDANQYTPLCATVTDPMVASGLPNVQAYVRSEDQRLRFPFPRD